MSTPITEVHLLNVPLDNSYKNQIYFGSKAEQQNYFSSKIKHTYDNITYSRKDQTIKVLDNIENLWDCNYAMYNNGSRWFYTFITKMEYVNDNVTLVYIQTDVYQTWLFDITVLNSFVVREHVIDDTIGNNLIDEGLETGEYKFITYNRNTDFDEIWFVIGYSDKPVNISGSNTGSTYGNIYGGIYSGLEYIAFNSNDTNNMTAYIQNLASQGKVNGISIIFTIPKFFLPSSTTSGSVLPSGLIGSSHDISFPQQNNLDGYVPKNNKLYTYPYTFYYVSNNSGNSAQFRFEDFQSHTPYFRILGNLSPNPTAMCVPLTYRGCGTGWEYGVSMSGFPLCSWDSDIFANWFAQNKQTIAVDTGLKIGGAIASGMMGNPYGVLAGVEGVFQNVVSIYQHSIQPDQAKGNIANGSFNVAWGQMSYYFGQMSIKAQYAQVIDNFFEMYGYKVNTVKVPNMNTRPYWNYVKTIDINIKGDIPVTDMLIIKDMFNKGVTLWHGGDNIGNYNLNNH